jgi:ribonuclease J
MRLRIHRGAHEIGGSCVELEAQGYSILLDLGLPLDAPEPDPSLLPEIPGLADGSNSKLLGVVISHPHGDHYGLAGLAHSTVPVFIGSGARIILMASKPFVRMPLEAEALQTYASGKAFDLGPFQITPFLTDHSAFDAHSFLVEAEGKRVFYSGDIRAHGRKAYLVEKLLRQPPPAIDVLLLEGTTLSRSENLSGKSKTESELEDQIVNQMQDSPGLVLASFSPQNIDRFVTIYRATRRAGREFIGDVYLAHVLSELKLDTLPQAASGAFRVYLPQRQRSRIIADQAFHLVNGLGASRIYPDEIASKPEKWVMLFRESMMSDIDRLPPSISATLLYSFWPGYLAQGNRRLQAWCEDRGTPLKLFHTSGHADTQTLVRFAKGLRPKSVIPIHTTASAIMERLIPDVVIVPDGEWHTV